MRPQAAILHYICLDLADLVALQQKRYDCNCKCLISKGNALKLHLANTASQNLCTGYGKGFVMVNQRRIETNVVILPDKLVEPWQTTALEALTEADFSALAELSVAVVLLGTGERIRFLHPRLMEPLYRAHIGFEVMDTQAACRTYNILVSEGRRVAAALFID